jgi:nucleoside-diphosphate-sugar epimerase
VSFGGPYDTSKSAMELCVRSYHSCYSKELPAIGITRAANVFGYGDVAYRRVIPNFVMAALKERRVPLTCRKNGRQFIHITDIIEGYLRAASVLEKPAEDLKPFATDFTPTFHFALQDYKKDNENFIRIEELADLVASIFGAEVEVQEGCVDYASNENPVQALNCTHTFKRLDWQPRIDMSTGIKELREWYTPEHDSLPQNRKHEFLGTLMEEEANKVFLNVTK